MKIPFRPCLIAILALAATGCSTVLRRNVDSVRSGIGDIYQDQTLDNLARLVDDPQGIPSLSDLTPGTVESDMAFNPSATIPFGNQVVTTVVGTAGETITAPSRAFTLGGSISNKLTLGVAPVSDPIRLRNAAAIYRFVLSPSITRISPTVAEEKLRIEYQPPVEVDPKDGSVTVEKTVLLYPQCILCLKDPAKSPAKMDIAKLQDATVVNHYLGQGWVHSESNRADHALPCHNGHCLSMPNDDYDNGRLRELTFLVMQAVSPAPSKSGP
jgi:hypothetical protein